MGVGDPLEVDAHLWSRNSVTSVDDEDQNTDTTNGRRRALGLGDGSESSEERNHRESGDIGEEEEDKKLAGQSGAQVGEEIEDDVKDQDEEEFGNEVDQCLGERITRRVDHGEASLANDDRPLSVGGGDLGKSLECVE